MVLRIPDRISRGYTFFADDTGQSTIRPSDCASARHVFALGGVVVRDRDIPRLCEAWRTIKSEFFDTDTEVKASDFVSERSPVPEISAELDRRTFAQGMLAVMMKRLRLSPLACFVDKTMVPEVVTMPTRRGGVQIDKRSLFEMVATIFNHFLEVNRLNGQIVCDEPGQGPSSGWADFASDIKAKYSRISGISFCESHSDPGLEVADVVVGLMRYAQERRELIVDGLVKAIGEATGRGLGIVHLRP